MLHEITNELEYASSLKLQKAQAYHEGYVKACEDLGRNLIQNVLMEEE